MLLVYSSLRLDWIWEGVVRLESLDMLDMQRPKGADFKHATPFIYATHTQPP